MRAAMPEIPGRMGSVGRIGSFMPSAALDKSIIPNMVSKPPACTKPCGVIELELLFVPVEARDVAAAELPPEEDAAASVGIGGPAAPAA